MVGWSPGAKGLAIGQVIAVRDAITGEAIVNPVRVALQEDRLVKMETNRVFANRIGTEYSIEDSVAPIRDSSGGTIGAVMVFRDVSKARAAAMKMSHMALHDALTNLPNRLLLQDRISQSIQFARREGTRFALLFLDLDNFKQTNDSLGHAAGDDLLRLIAKRLTGCLRPSDTVSRMGGDEFVVLLSHIESTDHAGQIAQRLLETVAEPYVLEEQRLIVTFSIGISIFPDNGEEANVLMRQADTAMYSAKKAGRNRYHFFLNDIDEAALLNHRLERDMRESVERGQFPVYYQPKVDSGSNAIISTEALVRWLRPDGKVDLPHQFLSLAEENGLILPIGRLVLREACRQNQLWQTSGLPPIPVAINVSGAQFKDSDLIPMIEQVLQETGMAAQYLELEITESTLIESMENAILVLDKLHAMGVRIALDDFGTGYSSLSQLKRFPIDTLKIDSSFIRNMLENANDSAIVAAIIGMGRGLGMKVIAEGVETEAQADYLRNLHCHVMQGYLFSRPLTADQATDVLKSSY